MITQIPQNSLGPFTIRCRSRPKGYNPFSEQNDSNRSSKLHSENLSMRGLVAMPLA